MCVCGGRGERSDVVVVVMVGVVGWGEVDA